MQAAQPIIIIKKRQKRHHHHSGAWKVAYADFVTAMLSLFIVLWLMNASRQVQEAVGGYFQDPRGTSKKVGTNRSGSDVYVPIKKEDMTKLKEDLLESIHHLDPHDKWKQQIEITMTSEGLRIELIEAPNGTFFELGSATPTKALGDLLGALSVELGKLPNKISVEGHTDSTSYSGKRGYDNWDLSTDRANEARRLMNAKGVRVEQIAEVKGFADQQPREGLKPDDPLNRRVTLIVQYLVDKGVEMALPVDVTNQNASPESGLAKAPVPVPTGQ
jgi:chemotaxis protein MotB